MVNDKYFENPKIDTRTDSKPDENARLKPEPNPKKNAKLEPEPNPTLYYPTHHYIV